MGSLWGLFARDLGGTGGSSTCFCHTQFINSWEFADENVGMNDINTSGHETKRDRVPLIGCTDMGISKDFLFAKKENTRVTAGIRTNKNLGISQNIS